MPDPTLTLEDKCQRLLALIARHGRIALAFSGGVGSSFLRKAAREVGGEIARLEVGPAERAQFCDPVRLDTILREIKAAGFRYVCLELEGYQTGSLNRVLSSTQKNA